jgi:signal transduction histidine kinase
VGDRPEVEHLAELQAALRRVATLVARTAPPSEVFEAVAVEVGRLVPADVAALIRYEADGSFAVIGRWTATDRASPVLGGRHSLSTHPLARVIHETWRPARIGRRVAVPVIVDGRLWGVVGVASTGDGPPPTEVEDRIAEFTELLASAIANAESREKLNQLAEQQAALRRVATLVARREPPEALFAVVAGEVAGVVHVPIVSIVCYEDDGTATERASVSEQGALFEVGTRWPLDGTNVVAEVRASGRPARIDDYSGLEGVIAQAVRRAGIRSTVGIPIVVAGRLWGAMVVSSADLEPLPEGTEARLADFTDLVATAIANAESRAALARLAEQQAALRRVATLVARAAPPDELFAAVTEEVAQLLPAEVASMVRYEPDGAVTIVAIWTRAGDVGIVGTRLALGGRNLSTVVAQTRRPARIDGYTEASGGVGAYFREVGIRSAVGTPIIVEGRLWGLMTAGSVLEQPLAPDTEARLTEFTDLLATAIANAESRGALAASRARIVAAADETRRGIERDLHDGVQQRLVSLGLQLRSAQAAVPPELEQVEGALSRLAEGLADVQDELLEMARGIHPAILARGGLGPAVKTLARRSPVPVELDVHVDGRLPERVEVPAYYVVSEALTNAAKHARASVVQVEVRGTERAVRVRIHDDGVGGADPTRGSGLVGLRDRVEAFGGTMTVESRPGAGTTLQVELPLRG